MPPVGPKNVLKKALAKGSPLRDHVEAGLQALQRRDRNRVTATPSTYVADSLALDEVTADSRGPERCWDYVLGTRDARRALLGVEVHPATPGEVAAIIEKKRWADAELSRQLVPGRRVKQWYWVASGSTRLSKNTAEYRRLGLEGIELVGEHLRLGDTGDRR
ncbi:hypothetical protein [Haliangium sp.]|uniref:hypothetical protein n=1 Tax=Haliangium sp. TaxID=2663208 RepID=UPI003D0EE717